MASWGGMVCNNKNMQKRRKKERKIEKKKKNLSGKIKARHIYRDRCRRERVSAQL